MSNTALVTTEKKHDYPILIVDRSGEIGEALAKELKNESLVVFVSRVNPEELDNVVHIPFLKKFPSIPDNTYSHIFLIDENLEIAKDVLDEFIKKAKKDRSEFIFSFGYSHASEDLINKFISSYEKAKVIVFGDIFKKDSIYNPQSEINKYIIQAKTKGKIYIPGDGTTTTLPVFFDDVIFGILETVFATEENKKIFYLFPRHKITLLTLSHMFKKADPDLNLDFSKEPETNENNFIPPLAGAYVLGESYNLEARIKKIQYENIKVEEKKELPKKTIGKEGSNHIFFMLFFSFFLLLLLPLITTFFFSLLGQTFLYSAKNGLEKNDLSLSKNSAFFASKSFGAALWFSSSFLQEAKIVGQEKRGEEIVSKINLGYEISNAAVSLIDASDKIKSVLSGKSADPSSDFSKARIELKNSFFIYNKEKQKNLIPVSFSSKLDDLANLAFSTIDFWPDIFGFNGQRSYLVLFQNNMELRPGGGFLGSYGILTLDKGKILSFKIYDVYDADGQLKNHVEPPYPIRRYLPSIHWFLRDSNFNVDFSKGAVASAVFLNSEMRQTVDGVIGVDLSFVKSLLSVVGPIDVPDYKEKVTSDNFFKLAERYSQDNFFPGSTQKKDFLRTFYNYLQLKISEEKNIPYLNLLQTVASSIYEKHIIFAFNNQNEEAAFSINGWSSSLSDERVGSDSLVNDFVGINEANIGANKVNYFVTRSLSQNVSIKEDGSIASNLILSIKNTAPSNTNTNETYKNYLRVILPENSTIDKITINGVGQKITPAITDPTVYEKKNFKPPQGLELQEGDQNGKTIYGFLVSISPQELKTIKIEYNILQKLNLSKTDLTYNLRIFKQPGIDFLPYDFSINFPQSLQAVDYPKSLKQDAQKITFSTQIVRDREILIKLAPK